MSCNEWREVNFGSEYINIIDGDRGKKYPKASDFYNNEYCCFLNAKNVTKFGFNFTQTMFITKEKDDELRKGKLTRNDIILTTRGTIGNVALYNKNIEFENMRINSGMVIIRADETNILNEYLYWILKSKNIINQMEQIRSGSAQPQLPIASIKMLTFMLPPIETQKKIAKILSDFDDKIEINIKINENLEQQAQAIFKSWFVDFEPFGGEMPEKWELTKLLDVSEIYNGYSYKGDELQSSNIAMATIKNFNRNGGFKAEGYKEIIPSNKIKETHYANKFDILVAHTDLTQNADIIGNAEIVMTNMNYNKLIFSMDLVKVVPKENINKFLLLSILKSIRFKKYALGFVNGTTVLHLSKSALKEYTVNLPSNFDDVKEVSYILENIYKEISVIIDENNKLNILRNTLLSKLIAGEIEV